MTVGWAVVGCSDITEKRAAPAIRQQSASRLVCFHSRDLGRAEAFAERHGAESASDDLGQVLGDVRVDAVYIATEVDRHCDLALAALAAGKHVLVEKPMALDVAQCWRMIDAARSADRHLAVAYYARYLAKTRAMKRVVDGGLLGTIVRAVVWNVGHYNPAQNDPKYWRVAGRGGGNCLADVGSHRIDLLCYLLGAPVRVFGLADRLGSDYVACDTETALFQFAGGAHAVAMANANVKHAGRRSTSIEIYGTAGALLTDPWDDTPVTVVGRTDEPLAVSLPENRYDPMFASFADALAAGKAPEFSGVDGMWATAVIAGAYESALHGQAVGIRQII